MQIVLEKIMDNKLEQLIVVDNITVQVIHDRVVNKKNRGGT